MMNITIIHGCTGIKFSNLDYGTVFRYRDVTYLKVLDALEGDCAVILSDPLDKTVGVYGLANINADTIVDEIYTADLNIYK